MGSRIWLLLGVLALPAPALTPVPAQAQTVTEADLVGPWVAEFDYPGGAEFSPPGREGKEKVGLVLWPDGLWFFAGGLFVGTDHGAARWRLVGDTLWLANDYFFYFHPMVNPRHSKMVKAHGHLGVMDTAIINRRKPYPVPDSVYWSTAFRDTTTACGFAGPGRPCKTWVYKVSKGNQQIHLVAHDSLSRAAARMAVKGVLTRDSLTGCKDAADIAKWHCER